MARPTTWRRSFNANAFTQPDGNLDLLSVQPGETLGGTWWSYTMKSLGTAPTATQVPLEGAVVVVGLALQPESETPWQPFFQPAESWLWWEQVGFDHELYDANQGAWMNSSTSGTSQRKAEGMRRNDGAENMTLRVCWQTFAGSATADETAFSVGCAVSALVLLP